MPNAIAFYYDYSSPYGYLAATRIDAIAAGHGRSVDWHPILLGAVFKVTGGAPLPTLPLKGPYAKRDMERCARLMQVPFRLPGRFPIATQYPARATLWARAADPARSRALALALYAAYFADDRDISSAEVTAEVAATCGYDRAEVLAAVNDAPVKDMLRQEVEQAIAAGVFGSPYILVDGEPFWGADRLDHVDRWLATGGW